MLRRNTMQRGLVLNAVASYHGHPTADDVYGILHQAYPDISKATVYRNLNILCDDGELFRLSIPNQADRFDYANEAHYHTKCIVCGKVEDLHSKTLAQMKSKLEDETGYELDTYKMVFEGICPDCKKRNKM